MTKAEIKKIQALDAATFLELQQFTDWFGKDDLSTERALARWLQTRDVMDMLNIAIDVRLPDFQIAFTIERRLSASRTKTNTTEI